MTRKPTLLVLVVLAFGVISWATFGASKPAEKALGQGIAGGGSRLAIPPNRASEVLNAWAFGASENPAGHRYLYIQAVRYKPTVSTAQIDAILRSMDETLRKIPQIKSIRSYRVVGDPRTYDYAVLMEFDSLEDLKTYGNSEIHRRWVKEHNTVGLAQDVARLTIDMNSSQ